MRAQTQYRASFALDLGGAFALSFIEFLGILVIFSHLHALAGWSLGEVAFLYGTSYISFQLADMIVGHLDQLPARVQSGEFDMVLIRPLGSLFQILTSEFALRRLGAMSQGVIVLGVALSRVHVDWNLGRVAVLATMPLCGIGIYSAVWVIGATSTFWTVRTLEILNSFTYGGRDLTSYPFPIYGLWLRRLFIYVVPLAFVNFLPSLYILGKPDPLGLPEVTHFLSPAVALVLLLISRRVWGIGVRHYRSTGS
jgi:ABC-2 type transport system permease protein